VPNLTTARQKSGDKLKTLTTMKKKMITCEYCGYSFDERFRNQHECCQSVLEDKQRQEDYEKWRRSELDQLEADEMRLSDF